MHPKQIENLLKLSHKDRVDYFIRYCADWEEVWGLAVNEKDWIIFQTQEGEDVLPLWPHEDLAEYCAFEEHKELGAKPCPIPVDILINDFIDDPDLSILNYGIFYNKKREALVLKREVLKKRLEEELAQYE